MLQSGWSLVQLPMGSLIFFSTPIPSRRTVAPGFTEPVTEMSEGKFLWVKRERQVRLTA
jgi:hypothetical protein